MLANFSRRGNERPAYICDLINNISRISCGSIIMDVIVGAQGANVDKSEVIVDGIYKVTPNLLSRLILKIPRIRVFCWNFLKETLLKKIVNDRKYDLAVIHYMPSDSQRLISICHAAGVKVLLFPWGSEVLRVTPKLSRKLKNAFETSDFIRGDNEQFKQSLIKKYPTINSTHFVPLTYASPGISMIDSLKNRLTKEEMANALNLPKDRYYIICGYNAGKGQQHKAIIERIAKIQKFLPDNYLLLFPVTSGQKYGIKSIEIKSWCDSFGLRHLCLNSYLTDYQMACLHLISDLFIHVQVTDLANSFIMESVYAGTKVINGSWLHYSDLERYGKPYYTCDSLDDLPDIIIDAINDKKGMSVSEHLQSFFQQNTWPFVSKQWVDFILS